MQAVNVVDRSALRVWLAEHGLDMDQVVSAVIRLDRRGRDGVSAWLDAEWFLLNSEGRRFRDETGDNAAIGRSSIPLRSWPPLRPVPDEDG